MDDELSKRVREPQLGRELRDTYRDLTLLEEIAKIDANEQPVTDPTRRRISLKLVKAPGVLKLAFQRGGK